MDSIIAHVAVALWMAERPRGRGRPKNTKTLLTGAKLKRLGGGRPAGTGKYSIDNYAWLLERIRLRKAELQTGGRKVSDICALRADMIDYYQRECGCTRIKAERCADSAIKKRMRVILHRAKKAILSCRQRS